MSKKKDLKGQKKHLSLLKKRPTTIFSDEKLFTVNSVSNNRTDHLISHQQVQAVPEHVRYTFKHPASAMILGLISTDGLYQIWSESRHQ